MLLHAANLWELASATMSANMSVQWTLKKLVRRPIKMLVDRTAKKLVWWMAKISIQWTAKELVLTVICSAKMLAKMSVGRF